ncbi:MAG: hypothetical protein ABI459_00385 [Deltaproteobacteria bacterium]
MAQRKRIDDIGALLKLKHEIDLQQLADARRAERALRAKLDGLAAELSARGQADDLSAAFGNDAIWAARIVVKQRELAKGLEPLAQDSLEKRKRAEYSFGRVSAFDGLVDRLK